MRTAGLTVLADGAKWIWDEVAKNLPGSADDGACWARGGGVAHGAVGRVRGRVGIGRPPRAAYRPRGVSATAGRVPFDRQRSGGGGVQDGQRAAAEAERG